jgi:hypothetical protein
MLRIKLRFLVSVPAMVSLLAWTAFAQGAGSCGVHLDILANLTSTHAAVADVPGYPGALVGYPAGAPGNPFNAYCMPGSIATFRLTVAPSALGPAPFGPGSIVSILYAVGTAPIALFPPAGFLGGCVPGSPWIVSVSPPAGFLIDGLGLFGAAPIPAPADPGHPLKLEVPVFVPAAFPFGIPVFFQAVISSPAGVVGLSNGVALIGGPNPAEVTLVPGLVACGAFAPTDEGFATLPTPPAFTFYGFPAPICHVHVNGFIDFAPGVPPGGCDFAGTPGDLGCPAPTVTASPRLAVNHFDTDLAIPVPAPRLTDLTMELDPGIFGTPRMIIRWKNVASFGSPPAPPTLDTNYASHVAELWGQGPAVPGPGGRMIVVRQQQHSVTSFANHDMVGVGPGTLPPFGPPPACLALALWTLWGFPPAIGAPGGAIYQDTLIDSMFLSNLAVVFNPIFAGPPPIAYGVGVF